MDLTIGAALAFGVGAIAIAVFLGRQMDAAQQLQLATLAAAANQTASIGDYLTVGVQAASAVVKGKK